MAKWCCPKLTNILVSCCKISLSQIANLFCRKLPNYAALNKFLVLNIVYLVFYPNFCMVSLTSVSLDGFSVLFCGLSIGQYPNTCTTYKVTKVKFKKNNHLRNPPLKGSVAMALRSHIVWVVPKVRWVQLTSVANILTVDGKYVKNIW